MSEADLKAAIKTRIEEFVPVRLHLSSGFAIDLTHPEAALIGRTTTAILIDGQVNMIANVHITRVEPLSSLAR